MRTTLEFSVVAATHSALIAKAESEVQKYLELAEGDDLASHADMELKVEAHDNKEYIAHIHVRIK
jgi:hypothetical protein